MNPATVFLLEGYQPTKAQHISCNIVTHALPDMYALTLGYCTPCIYIR